MSVVPLAAEVVNPLAYDPLEVVVGLAAFLLLLLVLRRTAFPVFERLYAEREDRIDGGMARAEETRRQADGLRREYEEQVAAIRAEAAGIRDEARADGQRIKAELRAVAEEEVARIRERGDEEIAAARDQVRREMRGELGALSTELAERVIGGALRSGTGPASAVEAFLAELEDRTPGDAARPRG